MADQVIKTAAHIGCEFGWKCARGGKSLKATLEALQQEGVYTTVGQSLKKLRGIPQGARSEGGNCRLYSEVYQVIISSGLSNEQQNEALNAVIKQANPSGCYYVCSGASAAIEVLEGFE